MRKLWTLLKVWWSSFNIKIESFKQKHLEESEKLNEVAAMLHLVEQIKPFIQRNDKNKIDIFPILGNLPEVVALVEALVTELGDDDIGDLVVLLNNIPKDKRQQVKNYLRGKIKK